MILDQFFTSASEEAQAIELASWLRVLSGVQPIDLLKAWETYQARGPRGGNGRLAKPTPHDMRTSALKLRHEADMREYRAERRQLNLPPPMPEPEPEREPVDVEAANAILAAAGFTPKRFAAVQHNRMARTVEDLEAALPATSPRPLTTEPTGVRPRPETIASRLVTGKQP